MNKLALSGGRTSARLLDLLLEQYPEFRERFIVTFCNTGKEADATLDFVRDLGVHRGVKVIWLEYTRVPAAEVDHLIYPHPRSQKTVLEQQAKGETTHWFRIVNYETARRNGEPNGPFDELLGWANVLPNLRSRMCSVQMKVRTMMRYLFSLGIYQWRDFIGIRADEAHRAHEIQANCPKYIEPVFPLIDAGLSERDILAYWRAQPFDLQLKPHEGNCDQCYLKSLRKRVKIAQDHPSTLPWWEAWEEHFALKPNITGDGKYFRKGQPYSLVRFLAENPEPELFSQDEDIPCGCADKGFVIANATPDTLEQ